MNAKVPTLTDSKGLGGIIALDGFDYQAWDAFSRLPAWLRNPAFEGMVLEGLEDFEARFFAPHAPQNHILDRFQAKSGVLARADVVDVFRSFADFEAAYPGTVRVQTLVTPALPPTLNWLDRDPGRVRRARPFYAPFAGIRAACDDKLRDDLVAEFGADIGGFFAESVEVSLKTYPDRAHAEAVFAAAMADAFPDLDVGPKKTAVAFAALSDLAAKFRGELLSRERLLAALAEAVGAELLPAGPLRVHVRSDLNAPEAEAVEVDASPFSGGGGYPGSERWRGGLFQPLEAVARWARERRVQRIALSGSYRLSTAFSVGWSFRSATGFEIDIPARPGEWSTDDRAVAGSAPLWQVVEPAGLFDGRLVVGIGVMRDPSADIQATREGLDGAHLLSAFLPAPIVDGQQAQASVQIVKSAVVRAVALLRPAAIDLYYVGPAAFAVALGHRWNALPPTQLHEFIAAEGRYVQTAQLG